MCYVELHSRYVPRLLDTSWFSLSRYLSKYLVIYQYNLQFTYEVKSDKKLSIKGCCDAQNHACLPCHVAAANNNVLSLQPPQHDCLVELIHSLLHSLLHPYCKTFTEETELSYDLHYHLIILVSLITQGATCDLGIPYLGEIVRISCRFTSVKPTDMDFAGDTYLVIRVLD